LARLRVSAPLGARLQAAVLHRPVVQRRRSEFDLLCPAQRGADSPLARPGAGGLPLRGEAQRIFTHADEHPAREAAEAFRAALGPLRETGKLGPLLIQFPWSFRYSSAAIERLERLADLFSDFQRVIEVRHASWGQPQALAVLRRVGGICNIDQPALHECLGAAAHVSGPVAYVRLHGRNAANWFRTGLPSYERYNYLYSPEELGEWLPRLADLRAEATEVYVILNNHYRGQGVVNALELRTMLTGERSHVPAELLRAYPRLRSAALPPREGELFDDAWP
jgi:uncharacterized protein YecE (DUF72 family)